MLLLETDQSFNKKIIGVKNFKINKFNLKINMRKIMYDKI